MRPRPTAQPSFRMLLEAERSEAPVSTSSLQLPGAQLGIGPAGSLTFSVSHPHVCPPPVRLAVLRRVRLFRDLDEDALREIDALMAAASAPRGAMLCRADEPASSMYVLAAGRAKSFTVGTDGREVIHSLLAPGDLFGAHALLAWTDHSCSVQALTDTCVLRIDSPAFRRLLRRFPDVALRVIDELGDQLHLARKSSALIASGSVQARVAGALDRLCDKFGTMLPGDPGTVELALPLSRSDLAGLTGATVESVSRVMSSMQRSGIISTGRRWTTVLDRERLRTLAQPQPQPQALDPRL